MGGNGYLLRAGIIAAAGAALAACTGNVADEAAAPSVHSGVPAAKADNWSGGAVLAQQVCAACHAIADGDTASPMEMATPFETLANAPGWTRMAFGASLRTSHKEMPNIILETDEIDDLYNYIITLRNE